MKGNIIKEKLAKKIKNYLKKWIFNEEYTAVSHK